jgi:hypothetical protein
MKDPVMGFNERITVPQYEFVNWNKIHVKFCWKTTIKETTWETGGWHYSKFL